MSRPGTKRRLQREQARKNSGVLCSKSTEYCLLWFLGDTVAKTLLWSNPIGAGDVGGGGCFHHDGHGPPSIPGGRFKGLLGSTSMAVFRSKVISDMLVVLFIGGRGLFPSSIFFFFFFFHYCYYYFFFFSVVSIGVNCEGWRRVWEGRERQRERECARGNREVKEKPAQLGGDKTRAQNPGVNLSRWFLRSEWFHR